MQNITTRIKDFNKGRNELFLQLKYAAMKESPFRFFRGTCHIFYEDFSKKPPVNDTSKSWICGDLHIENFGTYKVANGLVYFDMNDFDEAILAPVTWEIARMLTSLYLAVDALKLDIKTADDIANCFFDTYLTIILKGKPLAFERDTTKGLVKTFINNVAKRKQKQLLGERITIINGNASLKIIADKTVAVTATIKKAVTSSINKWNKNNNHLHWNVCDVTYRIAGTGSLGVTRFVILVHDKDVNKYILLDMKEALPSCLMPYIKLPEPHWLNEAERVVTVQDYMENVTPALLSTIAYKGKMFVIKKLQPQQDKMSLDLCKGNIAKLENVIDIFAEIAASAHLRSSGRQTSSNIDELIAFFKTAPIWKTKLLEYSKKYAVRVKKDYVDYCGDMK